MIYYYFSATVSPNVAAEVSEILALDNISEEEGEMARAKKSQDTTPKVAKLKVPWK